MIFYACDWLVWPGADYDLMIRAAAQLGSPMVQIEIKMDDAGCIYYVLALAVPDDHTLEAYIEHAGQHLGLTAWYPIPGDYYRRGELFLDLDTLQAEAPEILAGVLAQLDADGHHNQQHCP